MNQPKLFEAAFPYGADVLALPVTDIHRAKEELEAKGVKIGNWRVDERDGKKLQVFFVVAPDGLCYYFHQPIDG